jgi:hypothetical protein
VKMRGCIHQERDFLKDKLKWIGCIHQASEIGHKIEGGRDRHVRDILRNIEDKNMILRNRGLLRGTHIYLDEDLTLAQQEQQRKGVGKSENNKK